MITSLIFSLLSEIMSHKKVYISKQSPYTGKREKKHSLDHCVFSSLIGFKKSVIDNPDKKIKK
ncbi:hypothetical protein B4144_2035 [Bacillus atrophaeus]|nr:hypothetical protein B4144_2035 [Bacillus atrophaeus]